jgi:hypothetical protein
MRHVRSGRWAETFRGRRALSLAMEHLHAQRRAHSNNEERLTDQFSRIRAASTAICAPLANEDYVVKSMTDASPVKWHLAHTSWFLEQFVLKYHARGYRVFQPQFEYLFDSYYQTVGSMYQRPLRGLLTRPTVAEVLAYRAHVDEQMQLEDTNLRTKS